MENPCHHGDLLKDVFALKNEFGLKESRDFRVPKKWKVQLKKYVPVSIGTFTTRFTGLILYVVFLSQSIKVVIILKIGYDLYLADSFPFVIQNHPAYLICITMQLKKRH